MKPNTAVGFLLAGAALLRRRARDSSVYGLVVLGIGTVTLTEYLFISDLGIDQILFRDASSTIDPGRMSPITAVGFSFLGMALLSMNAELPWTRRASCGFGLLAGSLGFVALLGYGYDTQTLYRVGPYSSIALHTALGFVVAAVGIQCANPEEGLMYRIRADNAGGVMLRRFLPAALLIPFLIGFAAWSGHQHLGWELGFSMAVVAAATTFWLFVIGLRNASRLEQRDCALRRIKEELGEAQRLAKMGNWLWDADKNLVSWSEELYRIHGLDPTQFAPSLTDLPKFFSAESWRRLNAALEDALHTGSVQELDLELIRPDGTKRWISAHGEAVRDTSGHVVYLRGTAQDITDRKLLEQELYRIASDLKEAQRLAQLGSWTMDPDTGRQTWSDELYSIFGLDPSLSPPSFDEMAPLFTGSSWESLKIAKRAGNVASLELELIRPDGSRRWIFSQGEVERDGSGRIVRLRGTAQDITEQRKAEEALREGEERFRRVVEHVGDALFVDDVDGRVVFANDQFLKLFGFSRDELQNVVLGDYIAPEYRAELRDRHKRRMRGETMPTHFEYEGLRRDGTRMWLEVDVVAIKDQDGKLIGTQSALRDITSRKHAEHALRESEQRFRLVANAAPVMIWMSGTDKLCTYFNQPWLDFTGRPLEAELGNGWTDGIHPDDLAHCWKIYSDCFDRCASFDMEYRLRRRDGDYRWILDTGVPRFSTDGSFAGYIGSCIDVTERKRAEEVLHNLSGKLIAAQEEERKHIARELHDDINQQLALLAIALEQLKQNPPRSTEFRHRMEDLANRTSKVTTDIQALSHRLHSSKLEYLGVVMAMQGFCQEFSNQHQVEVRFSHEQVPDSLPDDISLCLFRVLQAALANAVKHSGVKYFEVMLRGTAGGIHLTVHDTGAGFDLCKVLTGHGIGLISMRERVHLVNGRISIQSKPRGGTTIDVDVPLSSSSSKERVSSKVV